MCCGRKSPWVPAFLRERSISSDKMRKATELARSDMEWMDQYAKPRLGVLVAGRPQRGLIAVCVLALTMFPLALVKVPAGAIVLLGIAIIGRDGLFAALGYFLTAVTAYLFYTFSGTTSSAFGYLTGGE